MKKFKFIVLIFHLFFFGSVCIAGAETALLNNGGRVFVYDIENEKGKIHTYMSTYKAVANATHIIELKDRLIIVDMQLMKDFSEEFRAYADSLHKPIDRLYLSHGHPDHWMGAIAFQDVDIYALPETIEYLKEKGAAVLKAKNKPGAVPKFAGSVQPGTQTIGGLKFELSKVKNGESEYALLIAIPELKTVIVQDLLYNATHLYLGHNNFAQWIKNLEKIKHQYNDYELFLCGHGMPASSLAIFQENIDYLNQASSIFKSTHWNPAKIETALLEKFPNLKSLYLLQAGVKKALRKHQTASK